MKSKALAIVLIVLGVGATLGGLYGQIFLAEDEGHHDGRDVTFAREAAVGAYELVVVAEGGGAAAQLEQAGQTVTSFGGLHGTDGPHVFVVGEGLDSYQHLTPTDLGDPVPLIGSGSHRVIVQSAPSGGPDLLELGVTTDIDGQPPVEAQNIVDDDEWTDGKLTVRRQGFDFVLSEAWDGDDLYDGPALLTLIRSDDFAFTHAHAEVIDGNRFSFGADLPGVGDFLAAVEFEQRGERVTAVFRFTL